MFTISWFWFFGFCALRTDNQCSWNWMVHVFVSLFFIVQTFFLFFALNLKWHLIWQDTITSVSKFGSRYLNTDVVCRNKDTLIPNLCRKSRSLFFLTLFFSDIGQSLVSLVEYTFMWLPGDCLVRMAETIWGGNV